MPAMCSESATTTLVQRFRDVCARQGGHVAVSCSDQQITYAELDAAAARVAGGLQRKGIRRGDIVGICMARGVEMIVAMLGVVKAGGVYLPLDVRYPAARIAETLEDAGAVLVIRSIESFNADPEECPEVDADDAAYVIYTSGSTGRPKGVVVTQANVCRLITSTEPWFHFSPVDVWTMFHSFAFDFSVWEIWGCLLTGGHLIIVPYETSRDPLSLRDLLVRERVTVLNQTPSAFALLDAVDADAPMGGLSLRVVIFGGEALSGTQLRSWLMRHGEEHPQLVNMYGITETTVHVTYRRMTLVDAKEGESLLGIAIPDMSVLLLDEVGAEASEGEICVGGAGVARGYLRRPELTAERFLETEKYGRVYRSGDMGRRRADGELVYCGRRDGQVKVNGFRIETGEVEAGLLACEAVTQACVLVQNARLTAYFVATSTLLPAALSAELGKILPAHMMPSRYVQVAAMPLNNNGKVDREVLAVTRMEQVHLSGDATEQAVGAIWTQVLGNGVTVDDNFFDVGGTSLLMVQVRDALQTQFGRHIPVTWMFECTTVKAMANRLDDKATIPLTNGNAERQRAAFARAKAMKAAGSVA